VLSVRKHGLVVAALVALQFVTVALPFAFWFNQAPTFSASWIAGIATHFSNVLLMLWFWMIAVCIVGIGVWWNHEISDGLYLEVWRYPSYRQWLLRRLAFALFVNAIVLGLGLMPVLLVVFHGEMAQVAWATGQLILYATCLTLVVVAPTTLGVKTSSTTVWALLLHSVNLALDGVGLPSPIQYFLVGERADVASSLVVVSLLVVGMSSLLVGSAPAALVTRGGSR
jgi:hypothetical protein